MKTPKRHILKVLFVFCPLISLIFVLANRGIDQLWFRMGVTLIISATCAITCMLGSEIYHQLEDRFFKWAGRPTPERSSVFSMVLSYPFIIPGLMMGFHLAMLFSSYFGKPWTGPKFTDYSSGLIFGLLVSGTVLLFEVINESKQAKKNAQIQMQKLENERLKAQVAALTAQMNPHLLFNSLNTIAATIPDEPEAAEKMVIKLSELYRSVLKSSQEEVHSLADEIKMCEAYLEIEKTRFGDRINYRIEVDPTISLENIQVPVLILQPIVENSVKHGLAPAPQGGLIEILIRSKGRDSLEIAVRDNGLGLRSGKKSIGQSGTGHGLSNCRSRLQIRYGELSSFDFIPSDSGSLTRLKFPLDEISV